MNTFKIKRTGGYGSCVEAEIYYGDTEVGIMSREALYGHWCNGCGEVTCILEERDLSDIFGEDNPIIEQLMEVTFQADRPANLWTMPKTQKELNAVLKAYRKSGAA